MPIMHFMEEDPVRDMLPEEGWLADYMAYSDPLEACARFRFFTACCAMGAAIGNNIWIHRGDPGLLPKLFPNPWIMLLAPPGRGHKTSTINMSVNCLQQACPGVRILADKLTPESLVKALSMPDTKAKKIRIGPRDATGLIKAPELSVFFGRQQYNTGLVSLVTDLYDYREEWTSETIMRGKTVLRHVCISIMGGSTPDWLQSMLPDDAFRGGFMSRFIIVEMPINYLKRVPLPRKLPGAAWDKLVIGLARITGLSGEVKFDQSGERVFEKMYMSMEPTGDPQVDAYQEREMEQVVKLAMLFALSGNLMEVSEEHLDKSKKLLEFLMEETAPRIERLTTHPRMRLVQDVQDLLKLHHSMKRSELMEKTYRGLQFGEQQFQEALRVMKIAGIIKEEGPIRDPIYTLIKRI